MSFPRGESGPQSKPWRPVADLNATEDGECPTCKGWGELRLSGGVVCVCPTCRGDGDDYSAEEARRINALEMWGVER